MENGTRERRGGVRVGVEGRCTRTWNSQKASVLPKSVGGNSEASTRRMKRSPTNSTMPTQLVDLTRTCGRKPSPPGLKLPSSYLVGQ